MSTAYRWGSLLAWPLLASWGLAAQVSDSPPLDIPELDPVVVSAPREGLSPLDLPFSVNVHDSDTLLTLAPRTLPDAIAPLPGIMIQRTARGQSSPYIRGFTGFRTLLLIDGIRLNNSVFREGPNQYWGTVDPFSIDRIEVVRGPSSVLHGSDAIGGAVNVTPVSWQAEEHERTYGGRLHYRGSTAESSNTGRVEGGSQLGENWSALVGGTYGDHGNLRAGDGTGEQPETAYQDMAADARVEGTLGEHQRLVFAHQTYLMDDAWRTHATIYLVRWRGTRPTSATPDQERILEQDRRLTYAQWHAENLEGAVQEVHASLSHHFQGELQDRLRSNNKREFTGFDVHTLGFSAEAHLPTAWGRWIAGGEYYRDAVDSASSTYAANGALESVGIQGPVGDDASYDLVGLFIENTLPALGPVDVVIGGRFNHAAAEAERVKDPVTKLPVGISGDWDSLVGSLRALWRLDHAAHWRLFGGISQGFRAPNLSDLTRFDIADGGQIETPSPDVEPEKFATVEGGVRANFDRFSAEAAYFYTDIDRMIIRAPTGQVIDGLDEVTKRNSGEGYVQGVEVMASIKLHPQWTLTAQGTWMEGEVSVYPTASATVLVQEPMSRIMPPTARAGLRWDQAKGRFWAEVYGTVADEQDRLAATDVRDWERIPPGGTPGYGVISLRAGWRPRPNLTVTLALENITDEDYRIHGSGLNEPGRGLIGTLDWRF